MIEEQAIVIKQEANSVWVEVTRSGTCTSCSLKAGCGQGLAQTLNLHKQKNIIRVLCDLQLSIGDTVIIGIPENLLIQSSVVAYLMPLLAFFSFAIIGAFYELSEPFTIVLSGLGFVLGLLVVRWYGCRYKDNSSMQPIVLRAQLSLEKR
ncbi:SoxR reducing system RseC family protein [Pseudomonas sp. F1_0610]|uniref:SoxR reducing system RseC family protein n=1 Tax=Pseudomonas sp. F1_0610 TaxID=3114284 RepID=UPI0039C3111D